MNSPILNRDFAHPADGWYHLEPKGEFPNANADGVVQVIDDTACQAIANRFNAAAAAPGFAGMLVDHEHFHHEASQESRAYAWLDKLQARADGLYGQLRWTNTGRAAVDGGDYRFFSTEYERADCVALGVGTPRRLRPTRLAGLSLTNAPNNTGGKPITNRRTPTAVGAQGRREAAFTAAVRNRAQLAKCDFATAWDVVKRRQPELWPWELRALGHTRPATLADFFNRTPEAPEAAHRQRVDSFHADARKLASAKGWRFERAWETLSRERPADWQVISGVER